MVDSCLGIWRSVFGPGLEMSEGLSRGVLSGVLCVSGVYPREGLWTVTSEGLIVDPGPREDWSVWVAGTED